MRQNEWQSVSLHAQIQDMRRKAIEQLKGWYASDSRKPLIMRGARQVGKTWLINEFARTEAASYVYINFEDEKPLRDLFVADFDMQRIIDRIQLQKDTDITTDTLIIFDEIQEAPHGITALKYFAEKLPAQSVIAAGSLLGIALHRGDSFPVGKVDFMDVCPMDFEEFLWATGNQRLANVIERKDWSLVSSVRDKLERLLRTYYFVGGMPKVVDTFAGTGDYSLVRREQQALLAAYDNDFSKHAPVNIVPRIRLLWNSVVAQLSKENKKFIFGLVKEGARAREYEVALEWLFDAGMLLRVPRTKRGELPLKAYADMGAFKIFLLDVGLLTAMAEVPASAMVEKESQLLHGFKGGLTEQYVMQQLHSLGQLGIYYWSADNSSGEIDFLVQRGEEIIPIEVKAEENLQSKSLAAFCKRYGLTAAYRFSMSGYRDQGWMCNVPLYAIHGAMK